MASEIQKPAHIFDRDFEWRQLTAFAERGASSPQLGVVSGRRRQGKTYLLEALVRGAGGLYFGATQATETESLRLFGEALASHLDAPVPPRFASWDEAIRHLFATAGDASGPVAIDEFPYLVQASPGLPSILQREVDKAVSQGSSLTLLLCGSAMSVMGGLLAGSAPLRGRATLELIVRPFDYRLAAQFWGVTDPRLAIMLHAVVGGTPAYRRLAGDDAPRDMADFDDWVIRGPLNPARPLFREARYLLEEDATVRDSALYHSVLAAVAAGNHTRGAVAGYVGRKAADIGHHLNVLEDSQLLRREPDVFRSGRTTYRIAEPLVTFYHAIMRPQWGLLESGRTVTVWQDAAPRFLSQVVGPHFEQLCQEHARTAPRNLYPELPGEVGRGVVTDHTGRRQIEIDVAVFAPATPGQPRRILSLGEAKWGEPVSERHIERLRRARDLLAERGHDTSDTVLTCYTTDPAASSIQQTDDVRILGLDDLYASAVTA